MVPWPAWAAGKINGPTEAAPKVINKSKAFLRVLIDVKSHDHGEEGEGTSPRKAPLLRGRVLVGRHLRQALDFLIQHAGNHVDFLVVELLQQRGWFVVTHIHLSVAAFGHENA